MIDWRSFFRAVMMTFAATAATFILFLLALIGFFIWANIHPAHARNTGQYSTSDPSIKQWFNSLESQNGLCCSYADGKQIDDVDWKQTDNPEAPYKVKIEGHWIEVSRFAVVKDPNKVGYAIVWPIWDQQGKVTIRCFIPGTQI